MSMDWYHHVVYGVVHPRDAFDVWDDFVEELMNEDIRVIHGGDLDGLVIGYVITSVNRSAAWEEPIDLMAEMSNPEWVEETTKRVREIETHFGLTHREMKLVGASYYS